MHSRMVFGPYTGDRWFANYDIADSEIHGLGTIINPLHPNINVHSLFTVLYTFPKVLIRRIWSIIKSLFNW